MSREGLRPLSVNSAQNVQLDPVTGDGWLPAKRRKTSTMGKTSAAKEVTSTSVSLTKAQQAVVDLVLRGRSVFLTGAAGTGKSVVLQELNRQAKRQVALTAATGVAALLIGGETTHSWSGLGQAKGTSAELVERVRMDAAACNRWLAARLLVIDEVSMISAHLLDTLDQCGRVCRGVPTVPFGNLPVLLCGDFHQLPPVAMDGWAFQAKVWKEAISVSLELTEVLRTDPQERQLAKALQEVREGLVSDGSWRFLQSLVTKPRPQNRCPVVVVPTNRQADEINRAALQSAMKTSGEVYRYGALHIGGGRRKEVPEELCLCQGTVVVLTSSIRVGPQGEVKWANGLRCCVSGFVELPRRVYDHRHPDFEAIHGQNLRQFLLRHEGRLPKLQALQDPSSERSEYVLYPVHLADGTSTGEGPGVVQLPIRLGWALTAHRAQGASMDEGAVALLRGLFSPGQAYVALSRCRRASDLWIEGLPARSADGRVEAFTPDEEVQSFYEMMRG